MEIKKNGAFENNSFALTHPLFICCAFGDCIPWYVLKQSLATGDKHFECLLSLIVCWNRQIIFSLRNNSA